MNIGAIRIAAVATLALVVWSSAWAELPKCHEEATALPDGWGEILAPGKDVTFALPPGLGLADDQPPFMHGGGLWRGPEIDVKITYGYWRMSSFNLHAADRVCQTQIDDIPVVLIVKSGDSGHSVTAWIQTKAEPFEPVLNVSFVCWDDIAIARHIIGSVRRVLKE